MSRWWSSVGLLGWNAGEAELSGRGVRKARRGQEKIETNEVKDVPTK